MDERPASGCGGTTDFTPPHTGDSGKNRWRFGAGIGRIRHPRKHKLGPYKTGGCQQCEIVRKFQKKTLWCAGHGSCAGDPVEERLSFMPPRGRPKKNAGGEINLDMGALYPKQLAFMNTKARYTAYGGARGGGKTHIRSERR
jgi:hypothetical protein